MKTAEHVSATPGPWTIATTKAHVGVYAGARTYHGCCIAYVARANDANARLIAQSPAMFALLKRYLQNHCENADAEGMSALCECKLCIETRAELAKAEGR